MLPTWIKLCGLSTEADVQVAVELGVQAVGFVFAESPRAVRPAVAAQLAMLLPPQVASVAVMLRPAQAQVDEVLTEFSPTYLQADWQSMQAVALPHSVGALPVYRESKGESQGESQSEGRSEDPGERQDEGECVTADKLPRRFVYEGAKSGQGQTVDWRAARPFAREREMVLAGGLHPSNVAEAMRVLRPFGVDVSSGIEKARGVKDPQRMREFVHQVRTCDRAFSTHPEMTTEPEADSGGRSALDT